MPVPHVSLVLLNGNVYTMDRSLRKAQAIAAAGEVIVAVGSNDEVRAMADESTRVIDLGGSTVLPGFVDCHTHILGYGMSLEQLDLKNARSLSETLAHVKQKIDKSRASEWVVGWGWDKNIWPEGRLPLKEDLDPLSPQNPVALWSKDYHTLWMNSLALRLVRIAQVAVGQPEGTIVREPITGEPTGIVRETVAEQIWKVVSDLTEERTESALEKAVGAANRYGLAGLHVCEGPQTFGGLQSLRNRGKLSARVYMMIARDGLPNAMGLGLRTGFGDNWLKIGPVKLFADGALGSQTAALLEPYETAPESRGLMSTTREELIEIVRTASNAGISSAIHAIGDAACRRALDAIEVARLDENGYHLRHRMEHVQLIQPEDVKRMAELRVIASVQPLHAVADRDVADKHWGRRCAGRAYAYKTLQRSGVPLAFGSDVPVETLDPLQEIYAAVTRKHPLEFYRPAWYPMERLSVIEAVRGYTIGAAYASGEENLKGSIEAGKLADMVVLSKDIFRVPAEEILQTHVERTIVGGKVVFEAD